MSNDLIKFFMGALWIFLELSSMFKRLSERKFYSAGFSGMLLTYWIIYFTRTLNSLL